MKTTRREKKTNKGIIGGTLLLTAVSAMIVLSNINCSEKQAGNESFSMPPMPVEVAKVTEQKVAEKIEAVGTIEAIEAVTVVSELDASVLSIPFEEGKHIKKGELIAQLDDSQLSAEVNRAEAQYKQSQATFERIKSIVDQKAGTPQDLDDAMANLKVAEANLKVAKARLNKTRIVAPFDGMAGARKISVGAFLRTGEAVTELANLNEIRVSFSAPERYLSKLQRGSEVIVTTPVYPDHEVKGSIIVVEPVIDSETRSARIVARVQNPGQKFRPGMSANVAAVLTERPYALTIPSEAVFASGNQSFVFVVNPDSTVKQVPVTTGVQLSDVVEVVKGLEDGMQVVQAGHQKLFEGARVMPLTAQQMSSAQ